MSGMDKSPSGHYNTSPEAHMSTPPPYAPTASSSEPITHQIIDDQPRMAPNDYPLQDMNPTQPQPAQASPYSPNSYPQQGPPVSQQPLPRQDKIDYKVSFGEDPVPIQCPSCHTQSMSKTAPVTGNITHAWALAFCAVCLLCCVPYCIKNFKNVEHKCPNCQKKLATWHRHGRDAQVHAWN